MNMYKRTTVLILVLAVSACASIKTGSNRNGMADDHADLVSRDFVTAISKLRGYKPRETTLQFYTPKSIFESKLHDAMRGAGYGIQIIGNNETANNVVTYESEMYASTNGTTVAYEVSVGSVSLSREYEIRDRRVFPITGLAIKGNTSSSDGIIDNSIFNTPDSTSDISSVSDEYKPIVIVGNGTEIKRDSLRKNNERGEGFTPIATKQNIAVIGKSNYESLFSNYKPVIETTLIFGDDSLRLGKENKRAIQNMSNQYNAETDLISVIGCSHGSTKITNGNSLLANGRASRVKEEFIMANVTAENILDEGCWDSGKMGDMPARGVLLTLRRKS